jgi:integrase
LVTVWLGEEIQPKRKARTFSDYFALTHRLAIPVLGKLPVDAIARADIQKLHHGLRSTPAQANSVLRILSSFFSWCEDVPGARPAGSNPCRRIKLYPEKPRERFLSPRELARLGRVLQVVERQRPYVAGAVRLLVLTGARLNEILSMQWDWIDLGAGTVRLPDAKRGPRTIHLSAPALTVLAALPRVKGNPHVISGGKEGMHLVNLEKPWLRIRKAALIPDVRLHDLRHSYASFAVNSRESLPMIGALLGHTQPRTTQRYAHLDTDPVRAANERVGQRIGSLLGTDRAGPVIDLRDGTRKRRA